VLDLYLKNDGSVLYAITLAGAIADEPATLAVPSSLLSTNLSPCSPFDTSITVTAQTDCDSIAISSIQFTGSPGVSISISPVVPAMLGTGNNIHCELTGTSNNGAPIIGTILIQGPTLDTTIPVDLEFSANAASVELSVKRPALVAHLCGTDSTTITLSNAGCLPITLDSLGVSPNAFSISSITVPIVVPADSTVTTTLYFSGETGQCIACRWIDHALDAFGHLETAAVMGTVLPLDTARVGLMLAPGSTLSPSRRRHCTDDFLRRYGSRDE